MKILVTGNQGYIGPIVEKVLLARGHEVIGLDTQFFENCELFKKSQFGSKQIKRDVRNVVAEDLEGVDGVIQLAAISNDSMGRLNPNITHEINHKATVGLAKLCKEQGISRFVFASSCSVYGIAEKEKLTEDDPQSPQTAYAESKVNSEKDLTALADENFSPVFLRYGTAFGVSPHQRLDLVLNNLVAHAITSGKIKIMSDGSPWRPMVHIEDMALAMACALEAPKEAVHAQAFNIGMDENNFQIKGMAAAIQERLPHTEVVYTGEHGADSRTYNVSFEKVKKQIPAFVPQWTIEKGVDELISAFKKHGLKSEDLDGERYIRLNRLSKLIEEQKIDDKLFWS